MKKHYWLPVFLLFTGNQAFAQQQKDPYIFPVKPGTTAWQQFKTGHEMMDATQIPLETLAKMNTEALVSTCLSYPLLSTVLAYNDIQTGFQAVTANFNGLQELLKRPDAGKAVLKVYQMMDPNAVDTKADNEKGEFTFEFTYVELLLAQPAVLASLTAPERKALAQEGLNKFKGKDNHFDTFGGLGEGSSALVLGRILEKEGFAAAYLPAKRSAAMRTFLATGHVFDTQIVNQIVADIQLFTK
jgi:hypothetical protein